MRFGTRKPVALLGIALGLFVPAARAQVHVGSDTVLRLTANASAGYVKSSAQGGLDSVNFGLNADLSGYYYHPNFLQFQLSPYYNQGREYSTADFLSGDKGFATSLNLFGGSNIPLFVNYVKTKTKSGLYGVLGAEPNVVGEGNSDTLNVNWSVNFKRLPSFQLGYIRGGGDYRIFGTQGSFGKSNFNGYVVGTQYTVFGFALAAGYNTHHLKQHLPGVFGSQQQPESFTDQRNLLFSASRSFARSTFFDVAANRSWYDTDATGQTQNRRFDSIQGGLLSQPVRRLSASFRVNYVSDLSALLLGSVLPGNNTNPLPATLIPLESRTRYLNYTAASNYDISKNLRIRSGFRHGTGRFNGQANTADTAWDNVVNYRRDMLGGRLTAAYSLGMYQFENGGAESSSQGHSGSVAYTKAIRGWDYTGMFQYSRSEIESLLPGQLSTLAAEFSGTGIVKGWRLTSAFRHEITDSAFGTQSENRRESFRLSLSRRSLNFAANIQEGSGLSVLTIGGIRPVSVVQAAAASGEFERLLIPTDTFSTSFTAMYQVGRRTTIHGSWARLRYSTFQAATEAANRLNRWDVHVRHRFRQLDCRAGFRHYVQKLPSVNGDYRANTVYFQVSRHFDVF